MTSQIEISARLSSEASSEPYRTAAVAVLVNVKAHLNSDEGCRGYNKGRSGILGAYRIITFSCNFIISGYAAIGAVAWSLIGFLLNIMSPFIFIFSNLRRKGT